MTTTAMDKFVKFVELYLGWLDKMGFATPCDKVIATLLLTWLLVAIGLFVIFLGWLMILMGWWSLLVAAFFLPAVVTWFADKWRGQ